jgi:RHS repeat-associated protein
VYGEDAFVPLARVDAVAGVDGAARAEVRHLHTDHLGTPREMTDADGRVVWAARYRAWGNVLEVVQEVLADVVSPDEIREPQPVRFQGQYYDNETGLHYNRFRYYDPDIGRFVSIDPIGLAGGSNSYSYASNPISWIDPHGLSPCKTNSADEANSPSSAAAPVFNPAGAVRAEKFAEFQQRVSARETIARIAGDNPVISYTESGKTLYLNPMTGKQVVYDNAGRYFRVEDTTVTGPMRYTDQFGSPIPNNVPLIKKSGISQTGVPIDVRKALTHFTDSD